MNGSSYAHYGLADGALDRGVSSYKIMIQKLKLGRCDFFPEELEVIGTLNMGRDKYLSDQALRHVPIEGATAPALHLITVKGGKDAALLPKFNEQAAAMHKSGELKAIFTRHAGALPY